MTFDNPPINAVTATTVAELNELVELIEEDRDLNVVVFDSASPDFYLAHYDAGGAAAPGGAPSGMHAWLELLARVSRAPVITIASIRGRTGGAGTEFVLACDLRFGSRETMLLDLDGRHAERYGYVTRAITDTELDGEVEAMASRLARVDHEAIARTKSEA